MTLGSGSQSESALLAYNKRKAQLERWRGSDTEKESTEIRSRPKRVKFADKCIFQAACASNDKSQVGRMIKDGYDINAVDEDGITALHQACIEDNFDMVEFLLQNGADVNISDNEGWTPLHAVATCCYVSIAKLLLEHGANVVALNNDCSIPLDICKSDEIRELFIQEINGKGIDLKDARRGEEIRMLDDAKVWLASGGIDESLHPVTGATALHVAACKGYIKVLDLLIKAGANMNTQDFDGWTPLHAAAHWGQREACEVLLEHMCDMSVRNTCDQTALDIADSSVVSLLEEWKKKHDVNKNIDTTQPNKQTALSNNNNNNENSGNTVAPPKKSASQKHADDDVTIVTSQLGQADEKPLPSSTPYSISGLIGKLEAPEKPVTALRREVVADVIDVDEAEDTLSELPSSTCEGALLVEPISFPHSHHLPTTISTGGGDTVADFTSKDTIPTTKSSSCASTNQTTSWSGIGSDKSSEFTTGISSDRRLLKESTSTSTSTSQSTDIVTTSNVPTSVSSSTETPVTDTDMGGQTSLHSWRRGGSLRTRTAVVSSSTSTGAGGSEDVAAANKGSNERLTVRRTRSEATTGDSNLRRAYSFESDPKFVSRLRDVRERIRATQDPFSVPTSTGLNLASSTTNILSSSSMSTTHTTTSTPAGSVSSLLSSTTSTSSVPSRFDRFTTNESSNLASSIATTSSSSSGTPYSLYTVCSRSSRLRSGGSSAISSLPTTTATTTTTTSLPTNSSSGSLARRLNKLNNSTEPTSSIICSSNTQSQESLSLNHEDLLSSTVILRRHKEIDSSRAHRQGTVGSPNQSSRAGSSATATQSTNTTTSSIPQNSSETKHTRSGVDMFGTGAMFEGTPQQHSSTPFLFHNSNSSLASMKPTGAVTKFKNFFKSFVPPTRDEESETQRKAHAKRVRETRRSTQGVTLEELKSAEQYVKNSQSTGGSNASGSTNSVPVSASSRKEPEDINVERRPSWRLRVDDQDRNKFSLEDTRQGGSSASSVGASSTNPSSAAISRTAGGGYHSEIPYGLAQRNPSLRSKLGKGIVDPAGLGLPSGINSIPPQGKPPLPPGEQETGAGLQQQFDDDRDVRNSGGAQGAILRKKKTKRRSTGVVQYNTEANYPEPQDSVLSDSEIGRDASSDVDQALDSLSNKNENGVSQQRINYKKLYEEGLKENQALKSKLSRAEEDIAELKLKLEKLTLTPRITSDDTEKLEKRALERKLSEMEEELKEIRHLRTENQKLRDENGALIRVISKLSK